MHVIPHAGVNEFNNFHWSEKFDKIKKILSQKSYYVSEEFFNHLTFPFSLLTNNYNIMLRISCCRKVAYQKKRKRKEGKNFS